MKGKINPGDFNAKPSDFSQNHLRMEKLPITTIAHMEWHMGVSTYFDFWEVAKDKEMQVPDLKNSLWQKRSFQVVSMVSHLHSVSINMTTSATTPYFQLQ